MEAGEESFAQKEAILCSVRPQFVNSMLLLPDNDDCLMKF